MLGLAAYMSTHIHINAIVCCFFRDSHVYLLIAHTIFFFFFFQAEDGIRDLVRSRGLGDVYILTTRVSNPTPQ